MFAFFPCPQWHFACVYSPDKRAKIRALVEAEEQKNYEKRMKKTWVHDVDHLVNALHATDGQSAVVKQYLTDAPCLIVVFKQTHAYDADGARRENYYVMQSTGIAAGFLIAAVHNAGLVTLPSTPMGAEKAIRELCGRPSNEKVFLLLPVGFPARGATVPYRAPGAERKPLATIMSEL